MEDDHSGPPSPSGLSRRDLMFSPREWCPLKLQRGRRRNQGRRAGGGRAEWKARFPPFLDRLHPDAAVGQKPVHVVPEVSSNPSAPSLPSAAQRAARRSDADPRPNTVTVQSASGEPVSRVSSGESARNRSGSYKQAGERWRFGFDAKRTGRNPTLVQ